MIGLAHLLAAAVGTSLFVIVLNSAAGFALFVLLMAALILVREASVVAETARLSLPRTLPQLVFALAMLALGIYAGRASDLLRRAGVGASFREGAGN